MSEDPTPAPVTDGAADRVGPTVTTGDSADFGAFIESYRRELHLHCYRLVGSLHEAEDLVQETLLRAWQHGVTFEGRAALRTWLYRIATNACLDVLRRRRPRTLPLDVAPTADPRLPLAPAWAESTWLEPFPDRWLADVADEPAARYARQESVSLAFLTVLQLLPPRQRAILILSDVLAWSAREIAQLLSLTVPSVNSALHRARVTLAKHYQADEAASGDGRRSDASTQALLERYLQAWESEDVAGLVGLLKEDATFTMPPSPSWYRGRAAIRTWLSAQCFAPPAENRWLLYPTGANGCPAFAIYRAAESAGSVPALGIQLLTLDTGPDGVQIADVTTYLDPTLLTYFGFPRQQPHASHERS